MLHLQAPVGRAPRLTRGGRAERERTPRFPSPGFAVQRVSRDPRREAAVDELRRQAQRLSLRLVFEVPDEFLAEAESWIPGKHVGTKVRGNLLGTPPRDIHGSR